MSHNENQNSDPARVGLLKAAGQLFGDRGFDGTTVRDIAGLANVNISLVSYYFQGKEGLYQACIEEFAKNRQAKVEEILVHAQSAEEFRIRLRILAEEMISFLQERPEACKIMMREIDAGLPLAGKIFESTILLPFKVMIDFLVNAQKKGFIRKDVDPMFVAMSVQGIIFHLHRTEIIRERYFKQSLKDPKVKKHTIDQLMGIILEGVMK